MAPQPKLVVGLLIVGILCLVFGIYSYVRPAETAASKEAQIQTGPSKPQQEKISGEFSILMTQPWLSTGIEVKAGQTLIITATGKGIWKNLPSDHPNAKPKPIEECSP